MTDYQRQKIKEMREQGIGYSGIACEVGLSKDSVKAYCRNHGLGGVKEQTKISADKKCLYCGKTVRQIPTRKTKKFCSDKCHMKWWNEHPELVKRKNLNSLVCEYCGADFKSKNPLQKFCSCSCYANSRKKAVDNVQ